MIDDIKTASNYLFLDLAIKTLEIDKYNIENSDFKIKKPYIAFMDRLISIAINEKRKLKSIMYKKKLQVNYLYQEGKFTHYEFIVDNNKILKCFLNHVIKKNVEEVISR